MNEVVQLIKVIIGIIAITLFIPGRSAIINSLFGLDGYSVNWGNWIILVCLTASFIWVFTNCRRSNKRTYGHSSTWITKAKYR